MRDYSKVSSVFWTGKTGKSLRGDMQAQVIAMYLLTSPHANMIGVFRCPIIYMAHETGSPIEGASKGLQTLVEGGFCSYDEDEELVWVHNMAKHQIGDELAAADKRVKSIQKQYENLPECRIKQGFYEKYKAAFNLVKNGKNTKPLPSPSEAPSKPETGTGTGAGAENTPLPPTGGAARFDAFWQAYPKKVGKDVAKRAFDKRKVDDDLLAEILKAVKLQAASPQWAKDGGQFIPNPATWLNGGRWQDEVQSAGDVVQADDSRPDWAVNAGFANVWEANNEGCFRHNAAQFANGRRKECRQNAFKTAQAAKTDSGQGVASLFGKKSLKTPVIGGGVAT